MATYAAPDLRGSSLESTSAENGSELANIAETHVATTMAPNYSTIEHLNSTAHAAGEWSMVNVVGEGVL